MALLGCQEKFSKICKKIDWVPGAKFTDKFLSKKYSFATQAWRAPMGKSIRNFTAKLKKFFVPNPVSLRATTWFSSTRSADFPFLFFNFFAVKKFCESILAHRARKAGLSVS
jgi:hypothetical protein